MSASLLGGVPDPGRDAGDEGVAAFDLLEALSASLQAEGLQGLGSAGHPALSAECIDALYAWGVGCYDHGRVHVAHTIFRYLCRFTPSSWRHYKALAASHLAAGDVAAAATVYDQARSECAEAAEDPEWQFFRGQCAWVLHDAVQAEACARRAQGLLQARAHRAAPAPSQQALAQWCAELLARLDASLQPPHLQAQLHREAAPQFPVQPPTPAT